MIAPKELRLSNWVEPITKSPCQITGIIYQKVKDDNFVLIYADYESFLSEHLIPIPLTPAWLKKFKFEETNIIDYPGMMHLRISIPNRNSITFKYGNGFLSICMFDDSISIPVAYVHTFQNIYHSLIGSEPSTK